MLSAAGKSIPFKLDMATGASCARREDGRGASRCNVPGVLQEALHMSVSWPQHEDSSHTVR